MKKKRRRYKRVMSNDRTWKCVSNMPDDPILDEELSAPPAGGGAAVILQKFNKVKTALSKLGLFSFFIFYTAFGAKVIVCPWLYTVKSGFRSPQTFF